MHVAEAMSVPTTTTTTPRRRWVTARVYAELHGLSEQGLANNRYQDRLAGRTEARPGYPFYKKFGGAVRYLIIEE